MKKMRETQAAYTPNSSLTIALPEIVAKDLNAIAKSEGIAVDQVVGNAIASYRRELGHRKIEAEIEAYHRKYPRLRARYLGKYIAMHNGRVVDHDQDPSALYLRIRKRFGNTPVLMRQVENVVEREIVIRSPRLEPVK
ncbi:MAG: hypothetical protein HZC40_22690 [Chloroflexi bacterium]|nr:hypothetical protein [Chloroflexota bacterium]